jgi:Glycosyl transferase family 2
MRGSVAVVSVLITTYNRAQLLKRALGSVLAQDFADIEITVIDDCSTDKTKDAVHGFADARIRYVRNDKNVGGAGGDIAILRRFLAECTGDYFVYLCDDDYWLPTDLISRQVAAMEAHPSLSFVQGGMVHCYPHPVLKHAANEGYVSYTFLDEKKSQVFWGTLYHSGFMTSDHYLRLFAADPKNRNIVAGATIYRTELMRASGLLERARGVRWQAGYILNAGAATLGDVYYIDEPCLMVTVDADSASHRGTQLDHMRDCISSIEAAFSGATESMIPYRETMSRSIFKLYMCNKIAHKFGWMKKNSLGDMDHIMLPPITETDFKTVFKNVALSDDNLKLIEVSDLPLDDMLRAIGWQRVLQMAS